MKYINHTFLSISIALFLSGCTEVIDFKTERTAGQLVIDGSIVNGSGPFTLYLGSTASTNRRTMPVEGATVSLFDDRGAMATYQDRGEGQYVIPRQQFLAEIGKTYFIRIELSNGAVYESERETMPKLSAQLDSIHFDFGERQELNEYGNNRIIPIVNAYVDVTVSPEAGAGAFFRFDVDEVYRLSPTDFPDPFGAIPPECYIFTRPDLSTFELLSVNRDQLTPIAGLQVASARLDFRFDEKHYFNVYLRSLTEGAYTFWDQLDQTISAVGTIFDTPPAPVRGNIYNVNDPDESVLGYFSAMSSDTIRAALLPEDTPFLPRNECQYSEVKNEYPARCLNCLSVPGSSYERPEYFK